MKVINLNSNEKINNTIVTIGKFDGLHKGHEKLISVMKGKADGRATAVLTFGSMPKAFLEHTESKTIVTDEEKRLICEKLGVDIYIQMPMTEEFLALTPDEFVSQILKDRLGATAIVCGPDFRFGSKAAGDVEFLKANAEKYDYEAIVIEKEKYHDIDICSTDIRTKIAEGMISDVNEMLGHPYTVMGKVEEGKRLGSRIGIATANIYPDETKWLPPNGVYRTVAVIDGGRYDAITNVGVNPTVEEGAKMKIETHLLDFNEPLYDDIMEIEFYEFVRPEKKFDSVEELKEQIEKDIKGIRQ